MLEAEKQFVADSVASALAKLGIALPSRRSQKWRRDEQAGLVLWRSESRSKIQQISIARPIDNTYPINYLSFEGAGFSLEVHLRGTQLDASHVRSVCGRVATNKSKTHWDDRILHLYSSSPSYTIIYGLPVIAGAKGCESQPQIWMRHAAQRSGTLRLESVHGSFDEAGTVHYEQRYKIGGGLVPQLTMTEDVYGRKRPSCDIRFAEEVDGSSNGDYVFSVTVGKKTYQRRINFLQEPKTVRGTLELMLRGASVIA